MNDYDPGFGKGASSPFFTNATVEIGGTSHQICVRGCSAADMTSKYFAAVDALTAAYAARTPAPVIDTGKLLALLQCGMEKAAKANDLGRMQRLVKAAALVQDGKVEREADGWNVGSQTEENKGYYVNEAFSCSCEDWKRHAEQAEKYYCKHGCAALFFDRLTATA